MGERGGIEISQEGQGRGVGSSRVSESSVVNRRIDQQIEAHRDLELSRVRAELKSSSSQTVVEKESADREKEQRWREENIARPWWNPRRWLHELFDI